ncbi:hypothetical protein J2X36_004515 [Methylobacterium sp. BE186]|nr:hypothetical protein [Methylobacterium sp. BE186]
MLSLRGLGLQRLDLGLQIPSIDSHLDAVLLRLSELKA